MASGYKGLVQILPHFLTMAKKTVYSLAVVQNEVMQIF